MVNNKNKKTKNRKFLPELAQDSRVEGCALTPFYKNTRITTNCWTTIHKKMLEPTKKDILHPKTKNKPQQDNSGGAIAIKSNPIPMGGQPTNWKTIIPQKFSHWSERSEPHVRFPSCLGVWQREESLPENLALKTSRIWSQDFQRYGENRNSTPEGHTQSLVWTRTQGKKAVTP